MLWLDSKLGITKSGLDDFYKNLNLMLCINKNLDLNRVNTLVSGVGFNSKYSNPHTQKFLSLLISHTYINFMYRSHFSVENAEHKMK